VITAPLDVARAPTSVQLLSRLGAEYGVSAATCLAGTGLTEDGLRNPECAVTAHQELRVIANLLEATGDPPGIGLEAGTRYHLTTYGMWGYALISSRSWRSAIDVGLRFIDLTFAFCHIWARDDGPARQLVLETPNIPAGLRRFVVERDSVAIQTMQEELLGAPCPLLEVRFAFPVLTADVSRHTEIFGVAPEFAASESAMRFNPDVLDRPLPQYNEHTAALTQAQCRQLLAKRLQHAGLAGQVRDQLLRHPSAPPNAGRIAGVLHMSERTLRRRLAREGVSVRFLLDEIREQLAEELLISGGLTVAQVAERLGYVEISSFSQAFRRWKGVGPRAYRSRQPTALQ
jgi:AraC-like DNA-binding protein